MAQTPQSGTSLRRVVSLTATLARSEFKLRYSGSYLGILWSALKPLALFAILFFAFDVVLKFGDDVDAYPVQLLLAIVLWGFFAETTSVSTSVLVTKADLIRKIAFPRIVLPLSVSGTATIAMFFNLIAALLIAVVADVTPTWRWVVLLPLLLELVVLSIGTALLLAAAFVRFRDIGQIWELAQQMLFYATPIIYPLSLVPEDMRRYLLLSPIAQIIQDARWAVVHPSTGTGYEGVSALEHAIPIVAVAIIGIVGLIVFNRAARRAAEFV